MNGGGIYEDSEGYIWVCECEEDWSWMIFMYGCLAAAGGLLVLGVLVKIVCFRKKTYKSSFSGEMSEYVYD